MNQINYKLLKLLCCCAMVFFIACKKDKADFAADNRAVTVNRANSTVRIINLAGFNQLIAQGDTLTNFVVRNPNSPDSYKYPGTSYFPVDGRLGKTWFVTQDLFNAQEKSNLTFLARNFQAANDVSLPLSVVNDYSNPTDYFLMPTIFMDGQPAVVPVKRGVSAPSRPDHFKIRIVNLSGSIKNPAFNASGALEDLTGAVSLAYADGTLVNAATNNISSSQKTSEYIELPFGTYQFKVLMQDGRQMPALGAEEYSYTLIDPPTSTIPDNLDKSTALTYAPIQTYQPGGIYTILIAPQRFNYLINDIGETAITYQNSFQLINDNSVPANQTYFRIQGANGWQANSKVSFRLNGRGLPGTEVGFGTAGEYAALVHGEYKIDAVDASGNVLASAEQLLRPSQNYTAWLYPDQAGNPKLVLVANDLSGTTYNGSELDDATYARSQYRFFFFKRFLNLSPDNPFISFTLDNGQPIAGNRDNTQAGLNMQPGIPLLERPFTSSSYAAGAYQIMAYRSTPNVVPGVWANDIPVLKNSAFIADRKLYDRAGRSAPIHEPGIYTVALIGRSANTASPEMKTKMIIIKHNK